MEENFCFDCDTFSYFYDINRQFFEDYQINWLFKVVQVFFLGLLVLMELFGAVVRIAKRGSVFGLFFLLISKYRSNLETKQIKNFLFNDNQLGNRFYQIVDKFA